MALSINTSITQNYKLNLTQSMRESLNILQMNSVDLKELLLEEIFKNPVVEKIDYNDIFIEKYSNSSDFQSVLENTLSKTETLFDHLSSQAALHSFDDNEYDAMMRIISSLDDNGFLKVNLHELVDSNFSRQNILDAIQKVSTFDPIGCGASNVKESLLMQIKLIYPKEIEAMLIIQKYFDKLKRLNFAKIAKHMDLPIEFIIEKYKIIKKLNPFPGLSFGKNNMPYIIPEAFVELVDEKINISKFNDELPLIKINPLCEKLIKKPNISDEEKVFLYTNIKRAKNLINAIEERQKTIKSIINCIFQKQLEFLKLGHGHLNSLNYKIISEELNISESTVSRTVAGKYIGTKWGVFELKSFFVSKLIGKTIDGDVELSSDKFKRIIKNIIDKEGINSLSDEKIAQLIRSDGIATARRTITKYRMHLGIPSAAVRKRLKTMKIY
jgi:RNA polymerase sigma-54 factor